MSLTAEQIEMTKRLIAGNLRGFCEVLETCEELKLIVGKLHERFMGDDSDKVIGELNHRIKQRVEKRLLDFEQKNPELAALMDDFDRPGDKSPPQR
jgi:hypothetical protein